MAKPIIEVITSHWLAQAVWRRWKEQYRSTEDAGKLAITEQLKDLRQNGHTTPEKVNEIIGNDSWTSIACDGCGQSVTRAARWPVSEPVCEEWDDYEIFPREDNIDLCVDCLTSALGLLAPSLLCRPAATPNADGEGKGGE